MAVEYIQTEEFEEVYRNYRDPVWKFLVSLSRDPAIAEELLQAVFLKLFELTVLGRVRREGLRPFIYNLAYNRTRDALQRRETETETGQAGDPAENGADESNPLRQSLERVFVDPVVSDRARAILKMRLFGRLSLDEICQALVISRSTAATDLAPALPKLRAAFTGTALVAETPEGSSSATLDDEFMQRLFAEDASDLDQIVGGESLNPPEGMDARILGRVREQQATLRSASEARVRLEETRSSQSPERNRPYHIYAALAMIVLLPVFIWFVLGGFIESTPVPLTALAVQGDVQASRPIDSGDITEDPATQNDSTAALTPVFQPVPVGTAFERGTELRLAAGAVVFLSTDEVLFRLRGPARLRILSDEDAPDSDLWLDLEQGVLAFRSAEADADHPRIQTRRARYEVTGTMARLIVLQNADLLEILEGEVSVEALNSGGGIQLKSGDRLLMEGSDGSKSKRPLQAHESSALQQIDEILRARIAAALEE